MSLRHLSLHSLSALRRLAAVTLTATFALGLAACQSTASFSSRVVAKPAQELKAFNLVLVENDLRAPGLASADARNEKMQGYGYYELGRLLKERAPVVLAANKLQGTVLVLPQPKAGVPMSLAALPRDEAFVLLNVKSVNEVKPNLMLSRAFVNLGATLYEHPPAGGGRVDPLWINQMSFRLGDDEAMGVLLKHRVDADLVDTLLLGLLNGMAADGLITLPQGKAVKG